ncbi:MAG: TerB family tellurite resistance protein [Pseudomonadota bacterium]|nr:TerB family tellurite resistance protein [Pseudomonadota bacterium]
MAERIVADSWRSLSAHENQLLRRIAELLHVTHADYIAAKMRAREAAGEGGG